LLCLRNRACASRADRHKSTIGEFIVMTPEKTAITQLQRWEASDCT
jgi:hypothetical protein